MKDSDVKMEIDEITDEDMVSENLSFYVFLTIRTAQLQHGLRHGDYERYRKYCTARLQRIRKKIGIASKKAYKGGKHVSKTIELAAVSDPRALQIPLLICERGWAYGMQKKGELAALGQYAKRRNTMLTKFRQAIRGADQLIAISAKKCDQRTCLEVEAYADMIKGIFYMETETKYLEALTHFTKSKKILEGLVKVSDVEVQSVFLQTMEEMDPNIRFCHYQLQKTEDLVSLPFFEEIQERLSHIELESKSNAETAKTALAIAWCNNSFPVKNEKLTESLALAQKHEKQLTEIAPEDRSALLGMYEKIISAYADIDNNIQKALAAGGGVSVFSGEDLEILHVPVLGKLLEHSIERTKVQIKRNTELFEDSLQKNLCSKKQQELKTRSATLVSLHDTVIGLILEEADLGAKLGGAEGELLIEERSALAACFQSYRCYYLAHGHYSGGNFAESYALFDRCIIRSNNAISLYSDLMTEPPENHIKALGVLKTKAKAFKYASQAEIAAFDLLKMEESQKQLEELSMEEKKGKKSRRANGMTQRYMADNLDSWESFAGSEGKNIRLFKIPPSLYNIPFRPIVLDSALNHIQRPDLKHRIPDQETSSAFAQIFKFTGWGKS